MLKRYFLNISNFLSNVYLIVLIIYKCYIDLELHEFYSIEHLLN
jgi:hypothetical protein